MNAAKTSPLDRLKLWFNRLRSIVTLKKRYHPEAHYMRGKPSKPDRTGK